MVSKRVPPIAAKPGLVAGFVAIAFGYFVPPFSTIVTSLHEFHFLGLVFAWLMVLMLVIGEIAPQAKEFEQVDVGAVDMTPWRFVKPAGLALLAAVFTIYATFADFSVLVPQDKDLSGSLLQSTSPHARISISEERAAAQFQSENGGWNCEDYYRNHRRGATVLRRRRRSATRILVITSAESI